jgi:hypothetical protein
MGRNRRGIASSFFTSASDGSDWSLSFTVQPLYHCGKIPGVRWIRASVSPRTYPDHMEYRKIPYQTVEPTASCCTD